jgi:hypothetical protein
MGYGLRRRTIVILGSERRVGEFKKLEVWQADPVDEETASSADLCAFSLGSAAELEYYLLLSRDVGFLDQARPERS